MNREDVVLLFALVFICGLVLSLILVLIDEGTLVKLVNKLKCKLGHHKMAVKIGRSKIQKYRCEYCKEPRKHLKIVDRYK